MRTKEDKCLICKVNDATKKGSHLMPAGLSAPCDNGRNKEELYFISETINVYYGSNNSKNNNIIKDITRHTNYNVMDFIFCPCCEKKLSIIESAVIPFLTNIIPSNKGFDKENKTTKGLLFREYSNLDLAEFKLFFYTVIWRLGLAQELSFGTNIFSNDEYEKLRSVIDNFLSEKINDITNNEEILNEMPLTIITSNYPRTSKNIYAPHRVRNNPPLFLACQYLVFIHFNDTINLNSDFILPLEVFNESLINKNSLPLKVALLTDKEWHRFLQKEFSFRAKEFQKVRIKSFMEDTGKSYQECGSILHSETFEIQINQLMKKLDKSRVECVKLYKNEGERLIHKEHLKGYGYSFDEAYKQLIEMIAHLKSEYNKNGYLLWRGFNDPGRFDNEAEYLTTNMRYKGKIQGEGCIKFFNDKNESMGGLVRKDLGNSYGIFKVLFQIFFDSNEFKLEIIEMEKKNRETGRTWLTVKLNKNDT